TLCTSIDIISFVSSVYSMFLISFFFLRIPPPPISTLFPYTTLFRSQGNFVFGQRFLRTLQVQQHVGKHFAGGQFGFGFADFVLVVGNGAQLSNRIVGVAPSVSGPRLHNLVLVLQAVGEVGPRTFARGFEQFVVMLQRVLCRGGIVKMAGGNGASPVRD